jgi:hypothetical protein
MPRVRPSLVALAAVLLAVVAAPPATAATAPEVAVRGDRLVNTAGGSTTTLQLRGVDRSGTEYACSYAADPAKPGAGGYAIFDGPTYDSAKDVAQPDSSVAAMQRWGVNAVRIPLSDSCWFGDRSLNPKYSGSNYQTAIADYVDQLGRFGITAILSLHVASTTDAEGRRVPNLGLRLLPMPDATQGPEFWRSVVQRMAGALPASGPRQNIVYDLFNEPHLDARAAVPAAESWSCWRDGCEVNTVDPETTPPATTDPTPAYTTAGMTKLVSAVREQERNSGSPVRPIMLGGLDYANDLREWTAHLPTYDDNGRQVVYPGLVASFHAYGGGTRCTTVACWDTELGGVRDAGRPVVTGEIGQYDCKADFTSRFTAWADAQGDPSDGGVSYLAWTWNAMRQGTAGAPGAATGWKCDYGPSVLKFNDGTPTDAYGLVYCQHLRARAGLPGTGTVPANPCPALTEASDPPADATPPPPPPDPTPTTPAPVPQPVDPGPFSPPITTPAPAPAPPATTPAPAATPVPTPPMEPRTAKVTSAILKLKRGRFALAASCAKGTTPCRGTIKVRTAKKVSLGRRGGVLVLISATYDLKAGRSAVLKVRPTSDGRALLKRSRRIKAVATATSEGGLPATKRLTVAR